MNVIGLPPTELYAFEPLVELRVLHNHKDDPPCRLETTTTFNHHHDATPIEDDDDSSCSSNDDDDRNNDDCCCCSSQSSLTKASKRGSKSNNSCSSFKDSLTKDLILPLSPTLSSSSLTASSSSSSSQPHDDNTGNIPRRVRFQDRIEIREYAVTIGDHPCCLGGLPLTLDWYHTPSTFQSLTTTTTTTTTGTTTTLDPQNATVAAERLGHYRFPRKLSYEQRKERLRKASAARNRNGHVVDDDDDNDAGHNNNNNQNSSEKDGANSDGGHDNNHNNSEHIDLVMKVLECSWSNYRLLPLPKFEALDDDDSDDDSDDDESDDEYCKDRPVQPSRQQWIQWKRVMQRSEAFME